MLIWLCIERAFLGLFLGKILCLYDVIWEYICMKQKFSELKIGTTQLNQNRRILPQRHGQLRWKIGKEFNSCFCYKPRCYQIHYYIHLVMQKFSHLLRYNCLFFILLCTRVKDCGLHSQKYWHQNFVCIFSWLSWFFNRTNFFNKTWKL